MIKMLLAKILTMILGVFVVSSLLACTAHAAVDQTNPGSWSTVADCAGINPIHTALLLSGKVLMVAGSGYNGDNFNLNRRRQIHGKRFSEQRASHCDQPS